MEIGLAPDADDATDTLETVAADCFSETVVFAIVVVGAVLVCSTVGWS